MPYTGEEHFPAKVKPKFLEALRGQTSTERTAHDTDGSVYAMDETSLQLLAAKNPIACALVFNHSIDNVRTNLIGLSSERLKDVAMEKRDQGSPSSPHLNPNSKPNTKPDRRYLWRSDM
jgi:hypothetical protein